MIKNIISIKLIFAFIFLVAINPLSNYSQANIKIKHELGFNINASAGSKIVTFVILKIDSFTNEIVSKKTLSEGNFVMYAKGLLKNPANPERIDFFKEVGIDCGMILDDPIIRGGMQYVDTLWNEMRPICLPVWDIWKLRYSIHPKYGRGASSVPDEDKGWSANRWRPSYAQTVYLQKYGVTQIQDYFHGPKMFELFKDMQNPDWIGMYMELN
ncbi:hypothetical protein N9544_05420 [Flavobacteriales bacterium]|nr:hypothetical protein [Flavobacteriales bacterium]